MRGGPPHAQPHRQQQQQQQQQVAHDEKLAQMLQAQYDAQNMHRQQHPSLLPQHQQQAVAAAAAAPPPHRDAAREERHRTRDEQLKMALEVNPEAFVKIPMLYVQVLLNNTPVKAFVDTGAQMTVMTVACAQRCNLLNAVDSRFRGVAAGVGHARIAGRVHMATLRFGTRTAVDTSITVLEQPAGGGGPELLLGLDLMRKYQATIDLGRNAMVIGGEALPFVDGDGDQRRHRR